MSDKKMYEVVNNVQLRLVVEAEDPNQAVRIARDTDRDEYQIGDVDDVAVYDADDPSGQPLDFDWDDVEALWGKERKP